jgi:hypothetical protein
MVVSGCMRVMLMLLGVQHIVRVSSVVSRVLCVWSVDIILSRL